MVIRGWSILVIALVVAIAVPLSSAQTPAPVIFFTDITSGPNSGGETVSGFAGAYVSIYGKYFGATQGTSTITLNGANCLRVVSWGSNWLWYQKIVVQLGASCSTGRFSINVGGQASTAYTDNIGGVAVDASLFTVRTGNIYCVSSAGSDSSTGHFPSCWATIGKAASGSGAAMVAGDITYVEHGVSWTTSGQYDDYLTLGKTGTSSNPIALVACPQAAANTCGQAGGSTPATVNIGVASTAHRRGILLCGGLSDCANAGGTWWTVAGLTLRSMDTVIDNHGMDGDRIVANDISGQYPDGNSATGSITPGSGSGARVYGNLIHDAAANTTGSVTKLFHSMYIADGSNAIDVGWNMIQNSHGNRGIQVFTSTASNNPPGTPGVGDIWDLRIHDNILHDIRGVPILVYDTSPTAGPIRVYNNLIYRGGQGPDFIDGSTSWDCFTTFPRPGETGHNDIYNNTAYDCGYSGGGAPGGGIVNLIGATNFQNNIFQQVAPFSYFDSATSSGSTFANNLFFGVGAPPSFSSNGAINSDPLFANLAAFDMHLLASSPAIDAGVAVSGLRLDHDGVTRPQGSGYDIGAYEFFAGSTVQLPNPPTNLTVVVQ